MKNYVSPMVELVVVNITDVITTSIQVMEGDNEFNAASIFS